MVKAVKVGVYGPKTRKLQRRMAYEAISWTWKTANVFRYLGSRAETIPNIDDIQVTTFMEVPDRAYDSWPVEINIQFDPLPEQVVDYSQFGVIDPIGVDQIMRVHINSYEELGRPLVEGDVLEVPFFEQDSHKAFWEVVDVDRGQEFEKFYAIIKLRVLEDSRKSREIDIDGSIGPALDDIVDSNVAHAEEYTPHDGVDDTDVDNGDDNPDVTSGDKQDGVSEDRRSFLDEFDGGLL